MYHTIVWGHSVCTRRRDYSHSGHDTRLCPDFKLSRTTSVEICGRGGLTVTRLTANGGALLNSVMCRVSKVPDIIFLQVGGNDFPRTAWNQRDADAFSLQLSELASLLNDRYKAKRVVVGCILPRFSARRSRRGLSPLEVRQYSGWAQAVNTGLTEYSQKVPHITVWKHNAKFTFHEAGEGSSMTTGYTCPHRVSTSCINLPGGNDCCLPFPAVSCTQQAFTVAISLGCMYVSSLDNKMMGIFYPNFLMLLPPPRPVTCFAPPLQAFLPLLAVDGCSPSDAFFTCFAPPLQAFLTPVGRRWVSSQ